MHEAAGSSFCFLRKNCIWQPVVPTAFVSTPSTQKHGCDVCRKLQKVKKATSLIHSFRSITERLHTAVAARHSTACTVFRTLSLLIGGWGDLPQEVWCSQTESLHIPGGLLCAHSLQFFANFCYWKLGVWNWSVLIEAGDIRIGLQEPVMIGVEDVGNVQHFRIPR